jgi:outer membrane protein TolC
LALLRTSSWLCAGALTFALSTLSIAQDGVSGNTVPSESQNVVATAPIKLTLADALQRAKIFNPSLALATANAKIAGETRLQARAANLPTVSTLAEYLYTQGDGYGKQRYIANDGVHEYIGQVYAHEILSSALIAQYRRSIVDQAVTRDQLAITQRGLVVTVVQSYAMVVASDLKFKALQKLADSAQEFLKTTKELENGGEVARADVVKAGIQYTDSEVALQEAQLAHERDRLALALLLFKDVNQEFEAVDDPGLTLLLPPMEEVQTEAMQHNPQLALAFDNVRAASSDITTARAGYLPTLTFDYFYGIDANHVATRTGPLRNLGYSAMGQMNWQIWNWGSTHSRVKVAEARKELAINDRKYAQQKLKADLEQFYNEAKVTQSEMVMQQTAAHDAEESLRLTTLQYKAGEATALEVVSAQSALSVEQNALEDTKVRYATALAGLATLTGTL